MNRKPSPLREALKQMRWTQRELARRTGSSLHTVHEICRRKRVPDIRQAHAIQQALAQAGVFIDVCASRRGHQP